MSRFFTPSRYTLLTLLLAVSVSASSCSMLIFGADEDDYQHEMDLITNEIRSRQTDPQNDFLLGLEEIPIDDPGLQSQVQVFRIDQGPYAGETYLIHGERVHPLGNAFGGHGLASMLVTDLDDNGTPELAFAYSFGSGIHQSRIGVYDPREHISAVVEANFAYLGDIGLYQEKDEVQIRLIVPKPGSLAQDFQDIIGTLLYVESDGEPQLNVQLADVLPEELREKIWFQNTNLTEE